MSAIFLLLMESHADWQVGMSQWITDNIKELLLLRYTKYYW